MPLYTGHWQLGFLPNSNVSDIFFIELLFLCCLIPMAQSGPFHWIIIIIIQVLLNPGEKDKKEQF